MWLRVSGPEQSWFDETWRLSEIKEVKSANGRPTWKFALSQRAGRNWGYADIGAGFGAIAMGIGVAMLYPHVLNTPLASLAGQRLGEAKS